MTYEVTKIVDNHNHAVSSEHCIQYSDNKWLEDEEVALVKQEISLGVTTHKLKKFVQENMDKKIDSQDIHNIKQKIKVEKVCQ